VSIAIVRTLLHPQTHATPDRSTPTLAPCSSPAPWSDLNRAAEVRRRVTGSTLFADSYATALTPPMWFSMARCRATPRVTNNALHCGLTLRKLAIHKTARSIRYDFTDPTQPYRRFLHQTGSAFATLLMPGVVLAHNEAGRVQPPRVAPKTNLTLHDARKTDTERLFAKRTTIVQMMFTSCSATCPIQGALFTAIERQLSTLDAPIQLLSISIDPLADDPAALTRWRAKHDAGSRWLAATPALADFDRWIDFLLARKAGPDRHTAQVYLFNRKGELALRTVDFPSPQQVVNAAVALHARIDQSS
jgi:protein SCO1